MFRKGFVSTTTITAMLGAYASGKCCSDVLRTMKENEIDHQKYDLIKLIKAKDHRELLPLDAAVFLDSRIEYLQKSIRENQSKLKFHSEVLRQYSGFNFVDKHQKSLENKISAMLKK